MVLISRPIIEKVKIKKNEDKLITSIIDRRFSMRINKNTFEIENSIIQYQVLQVNDETAEDVKKFFKTPECFVDTSHIINISLPKKLLLPIKISLPIPDFSKNSSSSWETVLKGAERLVAVVKLSNNKWKIIENVTREKLNNGANFDIWESIQR